MPSPLAHITREKLEPIWGRLDIPTERMAKVLGVSRAGLSYKAKMLGLPPRTKNRMSCKKCDDDLFRRMWMAGVNTREMAKYLGYKQPQGVVTRRKQMGLPGRQRKPGTKKHSGWVETISLAEFLDAEMASAWGQERASAK